MLPKIKTFEAACKALKLDPNKVLPKVSSMPKKHQAALLAHAKLVIIAQALNEGWEPNWSNRDEYKYFPYFVVKATDKTPSGSGLSFDDCDRWHSSSNVGSRLCFKSYELAEYAGKTFIKLYEEYHLIR
jgi:hypothetical protein